MQAQQLPNGIYIVFVVDGGNQVFFGLADGDIQANPDRAEEQIAYAASKAVARFANVMRARASTLVTELQQELSAVKAQLLEYLQSAENGTANDIT